MKISQVQFYTIFFIGFFMVSGVGAIGWLLVFKHYTFKTEVVLPSLSLAQECQQNIQEDGFGHVVIGGQRTVENENLTIAQPCKIDLKTSSVLTIIDSKITAANLLITSDESAQSAQLNLDNSSIDGQAAGLQISLKGSASQLTIKNSQISFASSVGLMAGSKDDDTQSTLAIEGSTITSNGQGSEGIILASTGLAKVTQNIFETDSEAGGAFLLAADCKQQNNTGLNPQCKAENSL